MLLWIQKLIPLAYWLRGYLCLAGYRKRISTNVSSRKPDQSERVQSHVAWLELAGDLFASTGVCPQSEVRNPATHGFGGNTSCPIL